MTLKYDYNLQTFYNENAISYYLLGAFITDGCVYKNGKTTYACQLSSCDRDWLEDIAKLIGTNLNIHQFTENYFGLRITRNEIAQWFINHGCTPRKTYDITLPMIPDKYFADFMRGCIDGDGSLGTYVSNGNTQRRCVLISASEIFLQNIQEKLFEKQIQTTITNRGKQNSTLNDKKINATVNSYSLNASSTNCFKLLKLIYYPKHSISLERKKLLAEEIITHYENRITPDLRNISHFNIGCKIDWPEDNLLLEMINKSNIEQLSITLGVHPTAIRNRLKCRGLYDQIVKYQKVFLPPDDELKILLKQYNYTQLSKHLDVGYKTLLRKLKERGLK